MAANPHRLTRRRFLQTSAALPLAAAATSAAGAITARTAGAGEAPAAGFRLAEPSEGRIQVLEADRPVLAYNWGDQLKEGVPADRKRSCYIHPVWGLDGEELTDDFPKDHYHHRGVFWTWQRINAAGQSVDLWTIKGIRQHFGKWLDRRAGPDSAALAVENTWVIGTKTVAKETVRIEARKAEPPGRAIDVDLTFEAADAPVELIGEITKGYGGLGLRFAPRQDTVITTPGGRRDKDSNLERFPWADLSARFAGREEPSGIAIFIHSANPGFPSGWTLRPYGFLGPCWPGLEPHTLRPGKPVTLKYRLWVHRGDAAAGKVAEAYQAYADAIKATPRAVGA